MELTQTCFKNNCQGQMLGVALLTISCLAEQQEAQAAQLLQAM